jgi:deoxyribodipyrimidine photo-lyase
MNYDQSNQRDTLFERLSGCFLGGPKPDNLPGGRTEALRKLHAYDPASYGRTRNHVDGTVSQLSPYLRHGMLSLIEVRDHLRSKFPNDPARLEEFFRQLAWRDFFEKVLTWYGHALDEDLEEPKHGVSRSSRIPLDVLGGDTGLPCIDGMLSDLFENGYLHNHARLWFAAYLCHFRGVRWQEGARLFRQHLYDGDIASNSASWQWVEGTFASKPYFMNKDNIANFSGGKWCNSCKVKCPFDADYPTLQHRLFAGSTAPFVSKVADKAAVTNNTQPASHDIAEDIATLTPATDLVWVHDAAISWTDECVALNPNAAVAFVFNKPALQAEPWAYHRLAFIADGIDDLFKNLPNSTKLTLVGDPVERLTTLAHKLGATTIHISEHPNPWVIETADQLRLKFRVLVHPRATLTAYPLEPKRFSRYWEKVAIQVLGHRPSSPKRKHQ